MRHSGSVKFFDDVRGYGFIRPDDENPGPDVFMHRTDFTPPLQMLTKDQRVSYELVPSGNNKGTGQKAAQIQLV